MPLPSPTALLKSTFTHATIPDLTGKTAIVTGGNTGIGYEVCKWLAKKNARVFMASRSKQRAEQAIAELKTETGKDVEFLELDLSSLSQAKKAGETFLALKIPLDILINNAGIMAPPFSLSKDGYESQMATNHLGHFQFTNTLLPAIQLASKPRIVNLSSSAHMRAPAVGIDFDNLLNEKLYSPFSWYSMSKLANILFTKGLQKRFGSQIIVNAVHPGVVRTELMRGPWAAYPILLTLLYPLLFVFQRFISIDTAKGAMSTLYAATSPEIEELKINGRYIVPLGVAVKEEDMLPFTKDEALIEKL